MKPNIISLYAALMLGGCTMIPHYDRPAAPVARAYPAGSAYQYDPTSAPVLSADQVAWQDFYRDPVIRDLIQEGLANNRDYRIAQQQIQAASAQFDIENAALFPNLNGTAGASVQKFQSNILHGYPGSGALFTRRYGVGFGISAYEVDLWGRVRSASQAAFDRYMNDVFNRESVDIALKASIATTVLNWVANNQGCLTTTDILKTWQKTYDLIAEEKRTGSANDLDVAEAEEALREAQKQLEIYERQRAQALNQLVLLVGHDLSEAQKRALERKRTLTDVTPFPDVPAGLPSDLLARRPDVLAAEQTLKASNDDIGEARAEFFPRIQLTADNGTASNNIKHLFQSGMGAWDVAPTITMPLFDAGRLTAQLKQAKARKRSEIASYERTVQNAFREVADALAARGTYMRQSEAQRLFVGASNRQFTLASARFSAGAESYLDTLVAQRTYFNAVVEGIAVELSRLSNSVTLYQALGGGWGAITPNPPFRVEEHIL
ncbi:efflux transporter outer membrane subunit [Acetobacter senegalensis]|uniref:efflux transporter outer membrane subunit n=1 Tax=Acetobacter senegalensis TaxID=446692 RepID=UPI001EDC048B|nr:efflux transporter outer membrane subunit [Acetobacter senegalensis]MCG4261946.1 efflux transporter outer membrane subunit [Acetobacter senegalensis]